MKVELTQKILKELLYYDPETGIFTWKERDLKWFLNHPKFTPEHWCNNWNAHWAGKQAGAVSFTKSGNAYIKINFLGSPKLAHRLAHIYMRGVLPVEVDHDNGDGTDNRWGNISNDVTHKDNTRNMRRNVFNSSGVTGVYRQKGCNKWRASIKVDGVKKHLGYFYTIDEAAAARKQAEKDYGFHKNHGQVRPR